ncbi:MAG: NPCBM/NEW2 domain-containing protein [Candidatus Brocadiae bacterium]|nr:NPCBM/NEW2 domain-containing protein [Candidatus Brocadiia bacterium]
MKTDLLFLVYTFVFSCWLFAQVSIVTLENQVYEGQILGINNENSPFLTLQTKKEIKRLFCQDIVQVVYQKSDEKKAKDLCVVLQDGSAISGEIIAGDQKALLIRSQSVGEISIDLIKIQEIHIGDFSEAPEGKDLENDVLYFKTGDILKCLIVHFGPGYVLVQHPQLGERKEYFSKLSRIAFAQLDSAPQNKENLTAIVRTTDHSLFYGKIHRITPNHLSLQMLSLEQEISILHSQIQHFAFQGGRFVYLSDLPLDQYKTQYIPYFPGAVEPFAPKRDKNQRGGGISLNGQSFFKGIGVLSRTEITVLLYQKYKKFQSHVGIDDQIREMYKLRPDMIGGSVVFQVYLDGIKKWDSGIVRWFDPSQSLDLNVDGCKEMLLVVDYADNANVNDLANWAGARLIQK